MDKRMDRSDLRQIADRIAARLHAELKARTRETIDIDTIRVACLAAEVPNRLFPELVDMTVRRVVERTR